MLLLLQIATFSWKGALIIISAIMLNCVVFGALFRPLENPTATQTTIDTTEILNENGAVVVINSPSDETGGGGGGDGPEAPLQSEQGTSFSDIPTIKVNTDIHFE